MWQMQRAQAVLEEHLQHPADAQQGGTQQPAAGADDAGSGSSSDEASVPPAAVQAGEPR